MIVLYVFAGVFIWLGYFVLMTPLMLVGFVLVPLMAVIDAHTMRRTVFNNAAFGTKLAWRQPWMWLWGNDEDGLDGSYKGAWPIAAGGLNSSSTTWQIIRWSAWRNSVGNARWTRLFGMTVDPKLRDWVAYRSGQPFVLKTGPYLVRQGLRFELKFSWPNGRIFWLGWRIAQQDTITPGVGFALQPYASL